MVHAVDFPPAGQTDLAALVPGSADAAGWNPDGPPRKYAGEDLYAYVNGGAEIFQEYGFVEVIVQDYLGRAGRTISLEIYEMKSPDSAYGIYSFRRSASGMDIEWEPGSEAQLSDYYLNLWKGRYHATLTGFGEDAATREGLVGLGRAVSGKIHETASRPSLLAYLDRQPGKNASIKYFRGNLGFYNLYALDPASIFAVREGARAEYDDGRLVFILKYDAGSEAEAVYKQARENFSKNPKYRLFRVLAENLFAMQDGAGRTVTVSPFQAVIFLAVGFDPDTAVKHFEAAIQNMTRTPNSGERT